MKYSDDQILLLTTSWIDLSNPKRKAFCCLSSRILKKIESLSIFWCCITARLNSWLSEASLISYKETWLTYAFSLFHVTAHSVS